MVDVKEAVASSIEYVKELYQPQRLDDLMLEEVELSDDEKYWLITVGFARKISPQSSTGAARALILNVSIKPSKSGHKTASSGL